MFSSPRSTTIKKICFTFENFILLKHICQLRETRVRYCYEMIDSSKCEEGINSIHHMEMTSFYACGQFFQGLKFWNLVELHIFLGHKITFDYIL